jgi:hypothetical protein
MKTTYWDLSERERAALTDEGLERYAAFELMEKGVLAVEPLSLEPEPSRPAPGATIYKVSRRHGYETFDAAFSTVEAAQAFIALKPLRMQHDYSLDVDHFGSAGELKVEAVEAYDDASLGTVKQALSKAKEIADANRRREQEHGDALKKQSSALEGLYADYNACREKAARVAKLEKTRAEYRAMAGDHKVAETFLAKAFTSEQIAEAEEWDAPKPVAAE